MASNKVKVEEAPAPPTKNKWEARFERIAAWYVKKSAPKQALIATLGVVVGGTLVVTIINTIITLFVNIFGWWNLLILPIGGLYFWFLSLCHEEKVRIKRGYQ